MAVERIVPTSGPFRLDLALRYYASSPSTIAEVISPTSYERAFVAPGGAAIVRASSGGDAGLRVEVRGPGADEAGLEQAVALATRAFGLASNPSALVRGIASESPIAQYVERYRGLRILAIPDPFEALVWAILGQQINIGFAAKLKRVLLERFGHMVTFAGQSHRIFPTADCLIDMTVEEMRRLQFSRQKTVYVRELARAIHDGALDLEVMRALPDDEVVAPVTRLNGIGLWTGEYLLLRGFGRQDAIPAGDMGLRAIVGRLLGLGRKATENEVRQATAGWAPWRGYVAFFLWYALQQRDVDLA